MSSEDWQVINVLKENLFIEIDCNSGKKRKIRTSRCKCGAQINIEYNCDFSGRADKKRLFHDEEKNTEWCLFRCKHCERVVSDSVPGGEHE